VAILFAALSAFASAQARTATAGLRTQVIITSGCSVVGTTLDFGEVNLNHVRGRRTQTNIEVTCSQGLRFQVGINDGSNPSFGQRRMRNVAGGTFVSYELYKSAFGSDRFGDAIHRQRVEGTGTGTVPVLIPVFGEILPRQNDPAGTYVDDSVITVYF
jgi:spore coat protein U-like protein